MCKSLLSFYLVCVWSLLNVFHISSAGPCMTGLGIQKAFVAGGSCYWTYTKENFTSWDTAKETCENSGGHLATIASAEDNAAVAAKLDMPAFIGYRKFIDGSWNWFNDSYSYAHTFEDTGGRHVAIIDGSGDWESTSIDAKGHFYQLLCSLEQNPHMRCENVFVSNSVRNKGNPFYAGERVKFTCKAGYHVLVGVTTQTMDCLPLNEWDLVQETERPILDCKVISCDLDDPPAYTTRDSEDHAVGDSVVYSCSNDTWFGPGTKAMIFECTGNGEWSPSLRPCEFVRCDPPPTLKMGVLDTTVTLLNHDITYTCMYGYAFSSGATSVTITCGGNPQSWGPQSELVILNSNCTRIYCADHPSAGNNAYSHSSALEPTDLLSVGYYQVWFCWEGDAHPNEEVGTSTICEQSQDPNFPNDWARSIPACNPLGCIDIEVWNSTRNLQEPIYNVGQQLVFTCPDEFVFPGGETEITIECMKDLQWDRSLPISGCDVSRCEDGWEEYEGSCFFFSNGKSLGLRYEYAETYCTYKRAHLALISSEDEAKWIATHTYEKYERDFWIGYHNNGSGWDWKGDFWTNFTNFAEGYPEYYDCARSSVKGYWKDRNCDQLLPYICKKTSICSESPIIAYGEPIDLPEFPVDVDTEILYVCDEGYRFKEGPLNMTIKCEQGGWWSSIDNCVEDLCPGMHSADLEVHHAWFDTTLNTRGSVVTFTCQDGYLFPDGNRIKSTTCLAGGVWSDVIEDCEEFRCPKPAVPDTVPLNGYDEWGDMDYYSCQPGFSFEDAEVSKLFWCDRNGEWLPKGQVCIPRACPIYSHLKANVTPDTGVYKDEISVQCKQGYVFNDFAEVKKIKCDSDGTWKPTIGPCLPTKCNKNGLIPPDVEFAFRDTDTIISGTQVTYTCLDDFVFINGDKFRVAYCDYETLEWVNVPTAGCVEGAVRIKTDHYHVPVEAPGAKSMAAIGFGILGSLGFAFIVIDLSSIPRYIILLKGFGAPAPTTTTNPASSGQKPDPSDVKTKLQKQNDNEQPGQDPKEDNSNDNNDNQDNNDEEEEEESGSEYETDSEDELEQIEVEK